MATFLTTSGVSHHLENIIRQAGQQLVLVSPYLQLSRNLTERLWEADEKGVHIVIVYGKDELHRREWEILRSIEHLSCFFSYNLHAKCYFNERQMIITSMNMYEYSERNNREMGVLMDATQDKTVFEEAAQEVESIVKAAEPKILNYRRGKHIVPNNGDPRSKHGHESPGYCIRCHRPISYDPHRPLCGDCFQTWNQFRNMDYREQFCHSCGGEWAVSFGYPVCGRCETS